MAATEMAIISRRLLVWLGSVGCGLWEIESLVLKATAPIRTPVMISFCMAKGAIPTVLECPIYLQHKQTLFFKQ
jgi:hypothetical protein